MREGRNVAGGVCSAQGERGIRGVSVAPGREGDAGRPVHGVAAAMARSHVLFLLDAGVRRGLLSKVTGECGRARETCGTTR